MGRITIKTASSEKPIKTIIDLDASDLVYSGSYNVTPIPLSQSFPTAGKFMEHNFVVGPGEVYNHYSGSYEVEPSTVAYSLPVSNDG